MCPSIHELCVLPAVKLSKKINKLQVTPEQDLLDSPQLHNQRPHELLLFEVCLMPHGE